MSILSDELAGSHPVTGVTYSTLDDAAAANALNERNISRIKASMSGDEVFRQMHVPEFKDSLLDGGKRQMWVSFCARSSIDPQATANIEFVKFIFGAGSTTVANLGAARQELISRAQQLGLGEVTERDVAKARGAA